MEMVAEVRALSAFMLTQQIKKIDEYKLTVVVIVIPQLPINQNTNNQSTGKRTL